MSSSGERPPARGATDEPSSTRAVRVESPSPPSSRSEVDWVPSYGSFQPRPSEAPSAPAEEEGFVKKASMLVRHVLSSPQKSLRFASDRLFQRARNSRFAEHSELAFRAGLYTSLLMLPGSFGVGESIGLPRFIEESRIRTPEAMVQFILTIYVTVGETVWGIYGGLFGNLLGTVLPCCIFFFHPEGVRAADPSTDPAFVAGGFLGSILVILVLWSNIGVNAKIFSLSTFVWHWMGFLDAGKDGNYSGGLSLEWKGPLVQMMLPAFSGSVLSFVCTTLPYPLRAMDKACTSAKSIVVMTGQTWMTAASFFTSSASHSYPLAKVQHYVEQMNEEKRRFRAHLDNAFWECGGSARMARRRSMLSVLDHIIYEACERITSVVVSCSMEDFGDSHRFVMEQVRGSLEDVITRAHDLLTKCTDLACEASAISDETRADIQRDVRKLKKSLMHLSQEFKAAKAEAGFPNMSKELLSEHAFCFAASNYAHISIHFGEYMCDPSFDHLQRNLGGVLQDVWRGTAAIVDHEFLSDKTHLNWTFKNSASVLLCFWIGVYGFGKLLLPYQAGIACTASILLSKYSGSAMKKNLARLQGVVIGMVTGQFGIAFLGGCDVVSKVLLVVLLGTWLMGTLFFYFDSSTYGSITMLMAIFGSEFFIRKCGFETGASLTGFQTVIGTVIAIAVMTVVDIIFSMGRPSMKAHEKITEAWELLQHRCSIAMDPLADELILDSSAIRAALSEAEELGGEAVDEPRYSRTPWKKATMRAALQCARDVLLSLTNLEFSVTTRSFDDAHGVAIERDPLFQQVMMTPSFMDLRRLNLRALKKTRKLLDILLHEVETDFPFHGTEEGQEDLYGVVEAALNELIGSANSDFDWGADHKGDLTHDPAARVSIVYMSILGMNISMRNFVEATIRGH